MRPTPSSHPTSTPLGFQIPMRGNELLDEGMDVELEQVSNPHEG